MTRIGRSLAVLALVAASGCPAGGPTRFAAVLPLTGTAEVYGTAIRNGIELAHEQLQKDPKEPRVELVVVDTGSDAQRSARALEQVYDQGAVAAIGAVTSAEAFAMVKVAEDQSRVLLSPSASQPQLSGISSNFYRIYPSDFSEGTVMARYAFDNLRLKTGVVLAKQETYAKGIQEVFREEFERQGGEVLERIEFPPNTADFEALADRAATLKPDFVYVAAYAQESGRLIRVLRASQYAGLILTTSSIASTETIAQLGAAAEGIYFTQTSFETEGPKVATHVKAFVDAYKARYGAAPDIYAAHGYDAYMVLAEALRSDPRAGPTSFWKGLRGIREYPGVTGSLQFDDKGDVAKFPHVYVVENGKAIDVEVMRERRIQEAREKMLALEREMRRLQNQGN